MAGDTHPLDPIAEARRQWVAHGWAEAAPGMTAITSLTRAQQLVQQRIDDQLRDLDLTFARYELLMLLHFSSRGALPMGVVGSRLQVHPTSVTSAVKRLEEQGFVRREPHPDDGRAKLAVLTDAGREVVLRATDRLNEAVFGAPGVDRHDTELLVRVLARLRRSSGDTTSPDVADDADDGGWSDRDVFGLPFSDVPAHVVGPVALKLTWAPNGAAVRFALSAVGRRLETVELAGTDAGGEPLRFLLAPDHRLDGIDPAQLVIGNVELARRDRGGEFPLRVTVAAADTDTVLFDAVHPVDVEWRTP